jgi:hypothetical protein
MDTYIHVRMVCTLTQMRIHTCMYACTYVCTLTQRRIHTCMYACTYICTLTYMHVCMYVCMHTYTDEYTYIHVCMYVCMRTYTVENTYMHICMYVCMHAYVGFAISTRLSNVLNDTDRLASNCFCFIGPRWHLCMYEERMFVCFVCVCMYVASYDLGGTYVCM